MESKYPQQRLCRHGRARHGLPRLVSVRPYGVRRGVVRPYGVLRGRRRRSRAARRGGKAGLSQRRRDARSGQDASPARAVRGAQVRRAPNARPRRCRRSSAAPETISFTRSPSCFGTGASFMSIWRLGQGKSRRAPRASLTKFTSPTKVTNRTKPTNRRSRIDFRRELGVAGEPCGFWLSRTIGISTVRCQRCARGCGLCGRPRVRRRGRLVSRRHRALRRGRARHRPAQTRRDLDPRSLAQGRTHDAGA